MAILYRSTISQPEPLLEYLLASLGLKRKIVKDLLKYGAVAVNGKSTTQYDHPLRPGDQLTVCDLRTAVATGHLEYARIRLVFEDEALLVVDKPPGLLTVATEREKLDTLYVHLNDFLQNRDLARVERALVVHRLDQDTSGLVLFAKNEQVKRQLQEAWPSVEKTYWAVVEGKPAAATGTVDNYLVESGKSFKVFSSRRETPDSKRAITHYRLLESQDELSLVEIRLQTGRKHQIRVHLADLGCPVVGDKRYGATTTDALNRLALHAAKLSFAHPVTREPLNFSLPLPKAFARLFPGSAGRN